MVVFAQSDLPIQSTIADVKTKTKVYLLTQTTDSRKLMQKAIAKDKTLEVVNDADKAEFILEYKQISKIESPKGIFTVGVSEEIGEMTAYFYNADKRKVIAWSETKDKYKKTGWGGLKPNETYLIESFIKLKNTKEK